MGGIDWETYRRMQQLRRHARLRRRSEAILKLKRRGYDVKQLEPIHFRINDKVDLYPLHNQWHDLRTGERGAARDLSIWLKEHLKPNE